MPITFTNTIYDDVIDSLATIINDEFTIPIHYDEHRGNQSFLLVPESDTLVTYMSSGAQREYDILVNYQLKFGGQYTKNNIKQVSNVMERLKRLILNNVSYSNGEKWFDANISNIEYEIDEDDPTLLRGIGTFNCQNIEVI